MAYKATIKDVAKAAKVSTTTVSRYLNHVPGISDELVARIENAIAETNYKPNLLARGLKTNNNRTIALMIPDICNPFYSRMVKEAQHLAAGRGYSLFSFDTDALAEQEEGAVSMAQQQNCSGILYAALDYKPHVLAQLRSSDIPVVGLNAYSADFPYDMVHVAPDGGTKLAMEHLIAFGHRHIAFAGGMTGSMIEVSRRRGYESAMQEHGLGWQDEDVFEMGFAQEDGNKAGRYFSTFDPLPTAICCANDQIALGVIEALQSLGRSVPEEISVTGMDDIPYSRLARPSLTTVSNDGAMFARIGMRMLMDRIDGVYSGNRRDETVPNTLICRASTRRLED